MLTKKEKVKIEALAKDLAEAFNWADTLQGEDYWLEVSENLFDMVGVKP